MLSPEIQNKIKEFCIRENLFYSRLEKAGRGRPDVSIVYQGITFYFEVKSGKDIVRPAQKIVHRILNRNAEIAFVVRSFEEFLKTWENICKKNYTISLTEEKECAIKEEDCRDCNG